MIKNVALSSFFVDSFISDSSIHSSQASILTHGDDISIFVPSTTLKINKNITKTESTDERN